MIPQRILIILTVLFLLGCSGNEKKSEKARIEKIGRYVYIDMADVLHTKEGCSAVFKNRNSQFVKPLQKKDVNKKDLERICSQCVTEKQLDSLYHIAEQYWERYKVHN